MADGNSITVQLDFADTVARVREALQSEGFGVITEIDIRATMADKLHLEYPDFLILGACNPMLAHTALQTDPGVAALLPCNVVVRRSGDEVVVEAVDPQLLVSATGEEALAAVADEAADRLKRVLDKVGRD